MFRYALSSEVASKRRLTLCPPLAGHATVPKTGPTLHPKTVFFHTVTNMIWGDEGESGDHIVPFKVTSEQLQRKEQSNESNKAVKPAEQSKTDLYDSTQLGSSSGHSVDPDPGSSAAELSKCLAEPARKTEQGDFDEYGWANIGSFDDLDRMFSNDVPIFGDGSLSGADELWSSSKNVSNSPSKQLPLVLEPGDLGLDIRTEIEHQQFPLTGKANGPPSSQSVGITPKPERYHEHKGQPSVEDQIYQQTKIMKFSEMCGTSKAKAFHDPYGRRTLSKTSPGKFVNQLAPSQSSSNLQSHSQGSGTSHYPHIPNQYMSTSGFDNHTNPYSSSLFQRPATAISPNNASARPSTMTPQEKLRRRQQMQAMLAIQRHQQQQFRHEVPLADQYITQNCCQDNPLQLVDKANLQGLEPGDSGNFADGVGKSSEFSVLYRLQDVVAKLDMGTRTCIRDSLFRLADSAGQRHHYASDKTIQDDQEVTPEEKSRFRYGGMLDTETVTNPTDRTVAHLLFHRPFDMSAAKHMEGGPESQASSKVGTGDKGKFPKCSTRESHINKQRAKEEEPPPAGSLDLGNASNSGSSTTVLVRVGC